MNKTYTERHLVKNISNKVFKRRYGVKKRKWGSKRPGREGIATETWMQRIMRKNPWLNEPEPRLPFADQAHLDSIKQEATILSTSVKR